jgi:2-polyprenyl-3-methyl-5-hydroxy-6-metoxy-1,4-benzoquinol methylase
MTMNSLYTRHNCDLCGSSDSIEVPHVREYTENQAIDICQGCGMVYVRLRRSTAELAKGWLETEMFENYTGASPAVKARHIYVAEFMHESLGLQNKTVCDIGAGEGLFLELIHQQPYGARVFGIEPSGKNCELMVSKAVSCFKGTIEDYAATCKDYQADIVTLLWTLENSVNCRAMLKAAYEILKPGGALVLATGSRILVPFKKPIQTYLSKFPVDFNCYKMSANTLGGILATSSFEVETFNRYIDHDVLCVIARKRPLELKLKWKKDDPREVQDYFERWHQESQYYKNCLP